MATAQGKYGSAEQAREVASEIVAQASSENEAAEYQLKIIARTLACPPVLGLILLGLVLFGETDASIKGSPAVTVSLVILAGTLILVPLLAFARSRDDYIKLRDENAERLREFAQVISKIGRNDHDR